MPKELQGRELPDVLLPYQQRAVSVIMGDPVTVIEKSRLHRPDVGIAAAAVLVSASSRSAGGMDSLYLGYSLDMAREFIDTAAMWAKSFAPAACEVEECLFKDTKPDGSSDDILAYRIVFASGYEIMALTSRPRSLRGRPGHGHPGRGGLPRQPERGHEGGPCFAHVGRQGGCRIHA